MWSDFTTVGAELLRAEGAGRVFLVEAELADGMSDYVLSTTAGPRRTA